MVGDGEGWYRLVLLAMAVVVAGVLIVVVVVIEAAVVVTGAVLVKEEGKVVVEVAMVTGQDRTHYHYHPSHYHHCHCLGIYEASKVMPGPNTREVEVPGVIVGPPLCVCVCVGGGEED